MEIVAGIALLLGIVVMQAVYAKYKVHRLTKIWEKGSAAIEEGDFVQAELCFRRCSKIMPLWLPARKLLAVALFKQDKREEAEEELENVVMFEPENPDGFVELGTFYLACEDRTDDALDAFTKAIEIEPKARETLANHPGLGMLRHDPRFRDLLDEHSRA